MAVVSLATLLSIMPYLIAFKLVASPTLVVMTIISGHMDCGLSFLIILHGRSRPLDLSSPLMPLEAAAARSPFLSGS
jgi:hypothetical protein